MAKPWRNNVSTWAIGDRVLKKLGEPFEEAEDRVRYARKFFVSRYGRIGWVPFRTRVGDRICVFQGVRAPFVLRPERGRWEIIGACYVHGSWMGRFGILPELSGSSYDLYKIANTVYVTKVNSK